MKDPILIKWSLGCYSPVRQEEHKDPVHFCQQEQDPQRMHSSYCSGVYTMINNINCFDYDL